MGVIKRGEFWHYRFKARGKLYTGNTGCTKEKDDDFILALFAIGTCTGLREGDICTLRWSEVDLESGWITRRTSKTGSIVTIPILSILD